MIKNSRSTPSADLVLALQRKAGNQSVARLLSTAVTGPAPAGVFVSRQQAGDGPVDAGVPIPAGVPLTEEQQEDARLENIAPSALADSDVGPALEAAERHHDSARYGAVLDQLRQRGDADSSSGVGVGLPLAVPRGIDGTARVTPEVALKMLENMVAGQPPFRPELGVGECSWFITEGKPHAGVGEASTVSIEAELLNTKNALPIDQAMLEKLYEVEAAKSRPEVETQVRERYRIRAGKEAPAVLSRTLADQVAHHLRKTAERQMWQRVGELVRASATKVGEVFLPGGVQTKGGPPVFSRAPGRFTVVAEAANIRIRGGPMALIKAIEAGGASPVKALQASAAELAKKMKLTGQVRTVLRVGGKILMVVAIAADIYEIIVAEDHLEATVVSAGGWAGASGAAAIFSAFWTPVDVAGPWAWLGHGVGMLASGFVGYWIGSTTTREIYKLVVQSRGQVRATP